MLAVPATWMAPVKNPVSANIKDSAKNEPNIKLAMGLSRSIIPCTPAAYANCSSEM